MSSLLRVSVTALAVAVAAFLGWRVWAVYMLSPWTRDGRVRADIVQIAPEVAGKVIDLRVRDNQFVHKGDVLFVIDPEPYRLTVQQAAATAESRKQDMTLRNAQAARRARLGSDAISEESRQQADATAAIAVATWQQGLAALDMAKLDLARTQVRAPVNGYVTNLVLRAGDYAAVGKAMLAMVDSDSFWISGYFEETKLPSIRPGDPVSIRLMGDARSLAGHVESISRGITDRNGLSSGDGLADVNPTFSWIRLAQRIPIRIHIDRVPDGVLLSAGMTCTLVIEPAAGAAAQLASR